MLDHGRGIDQLCGLRRRVGQGGKETITHFRRSHDDVATSISGLIWRLTPTKQVIKPVIPFVVSKNDPSGSAPGSFPGAAGNGLKIHLQKLMLRKSLGCSRTRS
jgi:hypothetical protein